MSYAMWKADRIYHLSFGNKQGEMRITNLLMSSTLSRNSLCIYNSTHCAKGLVEAFDINKRQIRIQHPIGHRN